MSSVYARVGELSCQQNSFLRELVATVVACTAVPPPPAKKKGADVGNETYDVVLSDSVLFPEGGGQPCDHGSLHSTTGAQGGESGGLLASITSVVRRGDTCVLSSPVPLSVGQEVLQKLDWARRLDHMQHHTAQHLLSAIVERADTMRLPTVSWSLTHPFCFIQVDVAEYLSYTSSPYHQYITTEKKLSAEMVRKIESLCNAEILGSATVTCDVYDSKEDYNAEQARRLSSQTQQQQQADGESMFRSRGIPDDVTGPIRIISLADGSLDSCTCCGTHLSHLGQLQCLQLLHQEVKGTTVKLHFVTGERALHHYTAMYERERALMKELRGCRPEDFVSSVVRRSKESAESQKLIARWTLELASYEAAKICAHAEALKQQMAGDVDPAKPLTVVLRRDDVDANFFTEVRNQLNSAGHGDVVLMAAWATDCSAAAAAHTIVPTRDVAGQISITGASKEGVEAVSKLALEVLAGMKGGVSKLGFRGKGSLKEWRALTEVVEKTLQPVP